MENNRRSFLKKTVVTGIGLGTYPFLSKAATDTSMGTGAADPVMINSLYINTRADGQGRIVVRPEDTGAILVNPGMSWVFHHYDNSIEKYISHLELI